MHPEGKLHQKQTSWVEPGCPFSGKHSDLHRPMGHTAWFASYGGQLLRKSWTQMCLWQAWKKCAPWLWPVSKHTKRWSHLISLLDALGWYVEWTFQLHSTKSYLLAGVSASVEVSEDTGMITGRIWPKTHSEKSQSIYFNTQLVYLELRCTSWCVSVNVTQVQWWGITTLCLILSINWNLSVPQWPN